MVDGANPPADEWREMKHPQKDILRENEAKVDDRHAIFFPKQAIRSAFGDGGEDVKVLTYFSPDLHQLHIIRAKWNREDAGFIRRIPLGGCYLSGVHAFKSGKYPMEAKRHELIIRELVIGEEKAKVLAEPLPVPEKEKRGVCMLCEVEFTQKEKYPEKEFLCYDCALIQAIEERELRNGWRSEIVNLTKRVLSLQKGLTTSFKFKEPEEIIKEMEAKGLRKTGVKGDKV